MAIDVTVDGPHNIFHFRKLLMFQKRKALSATLCSALWSFVVWLAGKETVIGRWSALHLQWFQDKVEDL